MKPVRSAGPTCYEACVASITEIPIAEIPNLRDGDGWSDTLCAWLRSRGWNVTFSPGWVARPGWSILSYETARGAHAVVCLDGALHHDPAGELQPIEGRPLLWTFLEKT